MVSISACHAEDPGSIPGRGVFCCARAAATSQLHFLSVAVFPFRVFAIGGIAPCTGEKVGRSEMEDCGSELAYDREIATTYLPAAIMAQGPDLLAASRFSKPPIF